MGNGYTMDAVLMNVKCVGGQGADQATQWKVATPVWWQC